MRLIQVLPLLLLVAACQPTGTSKQASGPSAQLPAAKLPETTPTTVVASWKGGEITFGEVDTEIHGQLVKMEIEYLKERHNLVQGTIDKKLNQTLLENEVKARGLPNIEALIDAEITKKFENIPEADIKAFYQQNEKRFGGKSYDEVKDKAAKILADTKKREAMMAFIDGLRTKSEVKLALAAPEMPRMDVSVDDDAIRGHKDAKVTIVEFADFQCPYCSKVLPTMKELLTEYDGKVRWVYRDYALPFHKRAVPAAIAAECAKRQGKFWEMHDIIMENQRTIEDADLERMAGQIALNLSDWKACLNDPSAADEVQKDQKAAQDLGVTGTPAFFINGILLSGAVPKDQFKAAIDKELQALK
jgi:protein-disulfide isomerase